MGPKSDPRRWFFALFLVPALALAAWLWRAQDWAPLAAWWVACNGCVLPVWAYDKWQAGRGGWRVPEATLHGIAIVGGAPASLVVMELLRHKTRKPWFRRLYWFLTTLQAAALGYWWFALRSA